DRAGADRADKVSRCCGRSTSRGDIPKGHTAAVLASLSAAGAASRMTWTLVPPKPNALTPARRCWLAGHDWRCVGIAKGALLNEICEFSCLKCRCGTISPFCKQSTVLIKPAIPAAASRCPILVLTEPSRHG